MTKGLASGRGKALFLAGLMIVSSIALATGPAVADSARSAEISSPTWDPGLSEHTTQPDRSGPPAATAEPNSASGNTGHESWYLYFRDVNTANGNLFRNHRDLSIGARGGDISFVRSYNSNLSGRHSALGFGWTHNYAMELRERDDGSVAFFDADGSIHVFESTGAGYAAPAGVHSRLTTNGSGYDLWRTDGHRLVFDADGTLQRITDANGNSVVLEYTGDRLTRIRDQSGQTLALSYTPEGRIAEVTDPLGRSVEYRYDAGDLVEATGVMGNSYDYTYYENHKLHRVNPPNDPAIIYTYYAGSDRVRCVGLGSDRVTNTCAEAGFIYHYDYRNDSVAVVNGLTDNTTMISLNEDGNPVRITDPRGIAEMAWDDDMNRIELRNESGTFTYAYDAHGNPVRKTDNMGNTVRMGWTTIATDDTYLSLLRNRTGPRGYTTHYRYDNNGNMVAVTNPAGRTRRLSYNQFGYAVSVTDFTGDETRYVYDTHGFRTAVISPTGAVTNHTYDAAGRMVSRTDPRNHTYRFERNARGDIVTVVDPTGNATHYDYDSAGRLLRAVTATGDTIRGGAPWQPDPTKGSTLERGDRSVTVQSDGTTLTRRFDRKGRPAEIEYDFGRFTRRLSYTYEQGNLVAIETSNGTIRYSYDRLDRITRIEGAAGAWVNYSYDPAGRRTGAVYSNGVTTRYSYDGDGRLLNVLTQTSNGSVLLNYSYTYDAAGNRLTSTDTNGAVTRYRYDSLDRLSAVRYPSGKTVEYAYDAVGHRLSKTINGTSTTRYHYSSNGELLQIDRPNATITYEYDEDGKRIQKRSGSRTTDYTYSEAGRLETVTNSGGEHISFSYLPNGERLSKTTEAATTYYTYNFFDVVAAYHANGSLARRYLHGPGLDDMVSVSDGGERYYYHQDGTTNVRALSDPRETLVNRYDYTPFGSLSRATETVENPYRFAGRRHDSDTGLYYNRHRYYDPVTSRFTKRDPAGVSAGINVYGYAENNPINYRDPSGLDIWTGGLAGAGIMVVFGGAGFYYGRLYNQQTGQSCSVRIFNAKFGGGLGAAGGIQGTVQGGQHCGKNLGGVSISAYVAAAGGPASGSATLKTQGGVSGSVSGGVGPTGGLTFEGGAVVGMVRVDDCTCECDCAPSDFCSDGQCDDPDDDPDDNHDLSVMSYERQYPFGGESPPEYDYQGASVGVLSRGFSAELTDFLVGIDERPASVGFTASQERLNRFSVLMIPTGGLQGISTLPSLERKLHRFVNQGGTLVVLPQKYGYDLEPVPGDLAGFGWREDQSCQFRSVGVTSYCSVLSSQRSAVSDINVDGYFTDYPANASVLLTRTKNGQPAMLKYGYGEGRVLASAAYTDWAYGHYASHPDGEQLLRDIVRWSKRPGNITTFGAGEGLSLDLNLTSYVNIPTDRVRVRLIDPSGQRFAPITRSATLSPFGHRTLAVESAVPPTPKPGIWGLEYTLINNTHGVIQQGRRAGQFAVSELERSGEGWTHQRDNISFSVSSSAENFPRGSNATFTFTVWNRGESSENVTVWWSLPHNYWETEDPRYGAPGTTEPRRENSSLHRTLSVPAGDQRTITYQVPVYADRDRLWAAAYRGNASSTDRLGTATKGFFTVPPAFDMAIAPDRARYAEGQNVTLDLTLGSAREFNSTVAIRVIGPENRRVHQTTVNATAGTGTVNHSVEFSLPQQATGGYYTVIADAQHEGLRVGYAANRFRVPSLIPGVLPSIPETITNGSRVNFTIANTEQRALTNATLVASLVGPRGTTVWNASEPVSVAQGEQTTVAFPLRTGPLAIGDYRLRYSLNYRDGATATRVRTLPNTLTTDVAFDRPSYAAGETAKATVTVTNDGRFPGSQQLSFSLPAEGFNQTRQLQLAPGDRRTFNFTLGLSDSIAPGPHGTVSMGMATTNTRSLGLFVRYSTLSLSLKETTYRAGETITVDLENPGGVPTRANCSVSLFGPHGTLVAENQTDQPIDNGQHAGLSVAIPGQAANGSSYVWTKCTNENREKSSELLQRVDVSGVDATISSTTDKEVYADGESVTITTNITNRNLAIDNGTITLRLVNASANDSSTDGSSTSTELAAPDTGAVESEGQSSTTASVGTASLRSAQRVAATQLLGESDPKLLDGLGISVRQSSRIGVAAVGTSTGNDHGIDRPAQPSIAAAPTAASALAIDNETVWEGTQKVLTEELVVNATGNLTLIDTTLRFDPSSDGDIGIEVRGSGELNIVGNSTIESLSHREYTFVAKPTSRLQLRDSTVRDVTGWPVEGLHVATSDAVIENVVFDQLDYYLLLDDVSGVPVRNSSFSSRLRVRGSTGVRLVGNRFIDEEIDLRNTAETVIADNVFERDVGGGDFAIDVRNGTDGVLRANRITHLGSVRLRDGSTRYTVENNWLRGEDGIGITISRRSNYTVVRNNTIVSGGDNYPDHPSDGIELASNHGRVVGNNVTDSYRNGIVVAGINMTIRDNLVTGSGRYDLLLDRAVDATLRNNSLQRSLHVRASHYADSPHIEGTDAARRFYRHDIDTSNTVSGGPIYYRTDPADTTVHNNGGLTWLVNATNVTVSGAGGVSLALSEAVTVRDMDASGGHYYGVFAAYSNGTEVHNVTAEHAEFGAVVLGNEETYWSSIGWNSSGNVLANNDFSHSDQSSIKFYGVADSVIRDTDGRNSGAYHAFDLVGTNLSVVRNNVSNQYVDESYADENAVIYAAGSHHTIADNVVRNTSGAGITVTSWSGWGERNSTVTRNVLRDNTGTAIKVQSQGAVVANNLANSGTEYNDGMAIDAANVTAVGNTIRNAVQGIRIGATNVTIRENTITGSDQSGVYMSMYYDTRVTVVDNTVSDNDWAGISIDGLSDSTIRGNDGAGNFRGIEIEFSQNITVTDNTVSGTVASLRLADSQNVTVRNNALGQGGLDIPYDSGSTVDDFDHDVDTSNTYRGEPIHYLVRARGVTVPRDAGAVWIVNSTSVTALGGHQATVAWSENVTVKNQRVSDLATGIRLLSTQDSLVANATVEDIQSRYRGSGFLLLDSRHNRIRNVAVRNSSLYGFRIARSSRNELRDVSAIENQNYGIRLGRSTHNISLRGVNASYNLASGVAIWDSKDNTLADIVAIRNDDPGYWGSADGIIVGGQANVISDVRLRNNVEYGIEVTAPNNTITGVTSKDHTEGILLDADRNTVANMTSIDDGDAVEIRSTDNLVTNLTAWDTGGYSAGGVTIDGGDGSVIADSNLSQVSIGSADHNTLTGTVIRDAVSLGTQTAGNLVYNNYFMAGATAYDASDRNRWNVTKQAASDENIIGGESLGGNFWADYSGLDLNGDGLGDTALPYNPSGNIEHGGDYHPLVPTQSSSTSRGPVVWSSNASVNVSERSSKTLQFTVPASALSEVDGKLKLTSTLESASVQTIDIEDPAIYVLDSDTVVTLTSDKATYQPGETVELSGVVTNTAAQTKDVTLTVTKNGLVIRTRTFTLEPDETESYNVTTRSQGSFTAAATAGNTTVSDRITVSEPTLNATVVAPEVTGREPFDAGVLLENTGETPVSVDVGIANRSHEAVTVSAGESRLVTQSMRISSNTTLNVSLTGDVTRNLSRSVAFGERVAVTVSPEPAYTPGSVTVPYSVDHRGRVDAPFNLTFEFEGRTIHKRLYLPPGDDTSGILRFNLSAGEYPLNYSTPYGTNQTTVRVTSPNQLTLNVTSTGNVSEGQLPVNVTLRNVGPNDVYGTLRANSTVFLHTREFNLSAGASRKRSLSIPVSNGAPSGRYNFTVSTLVDGEIVANRSARFAIGGPQFDVVAAPATRTVTVGDSLAVNVTVQNTGGNAGLGRIAVRSPGLYHAQPSVWLAPGEQGNVTVRFPIPPDLTTGEYELNYGTGEDRTSTTLLVDGLAVNASGSLEKPVYDSGETASLTLRVSNPLERNLSLFSRVRFNDYEQVKDYKLGGGESTTLTYDVPINFDGDEKIFYSVYAESGRSLYINGIRPNRNASANVTVYTDEPVYDIGDTVTVRLQTHAAGDVAVSAPGESLSWQNLSEGVNTSFNFEVPPLTSGTHYVHYSFEHRSYSYPFDVDGYHARLVETSFEGGQLVSGKTGNLSLRLESNRAIDGRLNASLYDIDGGLVGASERAVSLPAGTTTVTIPVTVPPGADGIYAVRYRLEGTVNPTFELLTGTEFVEVEGRPAPPNQQPVAAFSVNPTEPVVNETVTLDASAAVDPDGRITRYAWDLDNDSVPDATGVTATDTFTSPGTHAVRLTVTDDGGRTNTTSRRLLIGPAVPEEDAPGEDNETDAPGGGSDGGQSGGGGIAPPTSREPAVDIVADDGTIRINISSAPAQTPVSAALPGQAEPVGPGYGLTAVNVTAAAPGSVSLTVRPGDRGVGAVNENAGDVGAFTVNHSTSAGIESAAIGFYVTPTRLQQLGLAPDAVALYRYNGTAWTRLPTTYLGRADGRARYRALSRDGFSVFAISSAATAPPTLEVVDSTLVTTEVAPGQPVSISSTVENTGDRTGSFVIDLVVDGQRTAQTTVTLGPGERTTVEFAQEFDKAEQYSIAIGETTVGEVSVASTSTPGAETARATTQPTTPAAQQPTDERTVTTQQPGPVFEPGGVQFVPIAAILILLLVVSIGWYVRRSR